MPPPGARQVSCPPISATTVHGWGAALAGLPFLFVGSFIAAAGFGWVPVDPAKIHAPRWMVACAGGAFALAGSFLLAHGLGGVLRRSRLEAEAATHPGEPWRGDHDWEPGYGQARGGARPLSLIPGAMLALMFLGVFHGWAFQLDGPLMVKGMVLLFDAFFIFLALRGLRRLAMRWKYGTPWIELEEFPVRPGARASGWVRCDRDLSNLDLVSITLRHITERYEVRGQGKNRSISVVCYETWSSSQELRGVDAERGALPFSFELPVDAPTSAISSRPASFWDLEVRGRAEGVDFEQRFLVPVYARVVEQREAA